MYSIVVLSKNPCNLIACAHAVFQQERMLPRERFVCVDDGARSGAEANLSAITWLQGEKPFIFSRNANIGLSHAFGEQHSDVAILLNDDALLKSRNGFSMLANMLEAMPDYGIIAASTNNVGNENQLRRIDSSISIVRREKKVLCFICVGIRRDAWQRVGQLDERFVHYGWEDNDYSKRMLSAGYKLGIYDHCFVDHGQLTSTFRGGPAAAGDIEPNRKLYIEKWGVNA